MDLRIKGINQRKKEGTGMCKAKEHLRSIGSGVHEGLQYPSIHKRGSLMSRRGEKRGKDETQSNKKKKFSKRSRKKPGGRRNEDRKTQRHIKGAKNLSTQQQSRVKIYKGTAEVLGGKGPVVQNKRKKSDTFRIKGP